MKWFFSTWTLRYTHRNRPVGRVFSGRSKALVVDASGDGYLLTACDEVYLNPTRAGLLGPEHRLLEYPWSSFGGYLAARRHRPPWIQVDRLLGEHGIKEDSATGGSLSGKWSSGEWSLRRARTQRRFGGGWRLGSAEFKTGLLARMEGKLGEHHADELKRGSGEAKAERIIREELAGLGWTEDDLRERSKSDPAKLALAAHLRRETTLTLPRVAARLSLGSWKSAGAKLRQWKKGRQR